MIVQLYRGDQFYWWMQSEYLEKTTDFPKVIVKLYHITLYRVHLAMSHIRTHNVSDDRPIAYVAVYPTTVRSRPRRPRVIRWHKSKYRRNNYQKK